MEGALGPRECRCLPLSWPHTSQKEGPGPAPSSHAILLMPALQALCSLHHHYCSDGQGLGEQGSGSPFINICLGPRDADYCLFCSQEYERASKVDQFVTRFLLRETVSQLQALQSSLEGASDTLEIQARGPRYMRSPDNLWVQFTNAHYLYVPSLSALTTFHSFSILEPKLLFWAGRPRRGERNAGFEAGASMSWEACLALLKPGPVLGSLSLALRVCQQWTDPLFSLGHMKRERRCRTGPVAAGGQGAGLCGASVGHPPGLLVPLT